MQSNVISISRPKHRSYRIRSKFRLTLFISLLLIVIIMLTSFLFRESSAMTPAAMVPVMVHEGDTLWSIARQTLPRDRDIREYILEIRNINQLDSANIIAGQQLIIPVY